MCALLFAVGCSNADCFLVFFFLRAVGVGICWCCRVRRRDRLVELLRAAGVLVSLLLLGQLRSKCGVRTRIVCINNVSIIRGVFRAQQVPRCCNVLAAYGFTSIGAASLLCCAACCCCCCCTAAVVAAVAAAAVKLLLLSLLLAAADADDGDVAEKSSAAAAAAVPDICSRSSPASLSPHLIISREMGLTTPPAACSRTRPARCCFVDRDSLPTSTRKTKPFGVCRSCLGQPYAHTRCRHVSTHIVASAGARPTLDELQPHQHDEFRSYVSVHRARRD